MTRLNKYVIILFMPFLMTMNHVTKSQTKVTFQKKQIYSQANHWWPRKIVDINNDGLKDVLFQEGNAYGGWLGWLVHTTNNAEWQVHIISDSSKIGNDFAAGDIDAADIDNDGDTDVFGIVHEGEWEAKREPAKIYWFENPSWKAHYIGQVPSFIKDIEKADFNNDGNMDCVVITHSTHTIHIFYQQSNGWTEKFSDHVPNLHEGLAVGDINGDGFTDIATNGYWLLAPNECSSHNWQIKTIDEMWFTGQGNGWWTFATKNYCEDIDNDGMDEVFISHSEDKGYPLAWYDLIDIQKNLWKKNIVDSIGACHTLQVKDFNNDGHYDILAGENQLRWDDDSDPVNLYINKGDNTFIKDELSRSGIYNGLAEDVDNDGDVDFIRLPSHEGKVLEVWYNQLK